MRSTGKPTSINEQVLAKLQTWGLPLSDPSLPEGECDFEEFRNEVRRLLTDPTIDQLEVRARSAILGLLWALFSHYKPIFPEITEEWLRAQSGQNLIKLRRIALSRFSERYKKLQRNHAAG